jgi:hypothetical protein
MQPRDTRTQNERMPKAHVHDAQAPRDHGRTVVAVSAYPTAGIARPHKVEGPAPTRMAPVPLWERRKDTNPNGAVSSGGA